MAFDKGELKQLDHLLGSRFNEQRSLILLDVRTLLRPIINDLEDVKKQLGQIFQALSEDVAVAYKDIEALKKKVARMEREIAVLKGR